MRKLLLLPLALLLGLMTECVYEDFDKPVPTEVFAGDRKVLYIVIDGMRHDAIGEELTPNIWSVIQNGNTAWTTTGLNENITWSGPNWSTLLTGVHHQKHNVKDNFFVDPRFEAWPSIFYRLETTYMNFETASFVNWEPVNEIIIRNCVDQQASGDDGSMAGNAVDLLETDFETDLLFVGFNDVDAAGHATGFTPNNPTYANAVVNTDERVGNILDALYSRTTFADENWLIVMTTDHGGEGLGHAGNPSNPNIRNSYVVISGNAVINPGNFENNPELVDLPTTILKYFGITSEVLDGQVIAIE
jgi:predicted AlkP superfamily pyrophosphatase or phosphodiesterase